MLADWLPASGVVAPPAVAFAVATKRSVEWAATVNALPATVAWPPMTAVVVASIRPTATVAPTTPETAEPSAMALTVVLPVAVIPIAPVADRAPVSPSWARAVLVAFTTAASAVPDSRAVISGVARGASMSVVAVAARVIPPWVVVTLLEPRTSTAANTSDVSVATGVSAAAVPLAVAVAVNATSPVAFRVADCSSMVACACGCAINRPVWVSEAVAVRVRLPPEIRLPAAAMEAVPPEVCVAIRLTSPAFQTEPPWLSTPARNWAPDSRLMVGAVMLIVPESPAEKPPERLRVSMMPLPSTVMLLLASSVTLPPGLKMLGKTLVPAGGLDVLPMMRSVGS